MRRRPEHFPGLHVAQKPRIIHFKARASYHRMH